jgi:SWI/SNF-related matrix-associated actin-dependent regulator 1 of chromatin subfamily A
MRLPNQPHRAFLAGVACAAACVLVAAPAGAQSISDLESRIASAESEAGGLAAAIETKSAELAAAQAQAQAAAQREAELSATLARGEERSAQLDADVAEGEAALADARERLSRALDALSDRLIAMYKGDMPDSTTLLLESDGFDDLATRTEYLRRIEQADSALAERVRVLRAQVATQLELVEAARAEQRAFNAQVADARDQIASARAAAEQAAGQLAAARAAQQDALAGLQSQVDGWTSEVQKLRAAQQQEASAAAAQDEVADWVQNGDWAIPEGIVMCESGGNYNAVNPSSGAGGAYQILPSTWDLYGGSGKPQDASPAEQDEIASQIWADSGGGAWVCAG